MNQETTGEYQETVKSAVPVTAAADLNTSISAAAVMRETVEYADVLKSALAPEIIRQAKSYLPQAGKTALTGRFKADPGYGPLESYATAPDGACLSQLQFAEQYLCAVNNISRHAESLLDAGRSVEQLRTERESLLAHLKSGSPSIPEPDQGAQLRAQYEQSIRTEIVRLAHADPDDPELRFRAINQALLVLELSERELVTRELLRTGGAQKLLEYGSMMHEARSRAAGGGLKETLCAFVEIVQERHGYFPEIEIIDDFDGRLTKDPESGSPFKPGELTNALISRVDTLARLPAYSRMALSECPGLDERRHAAAAQLYALAAHESKFFEDVPDYFALLGDAGIEHSILTGNHRRLIMEKLRQEELSVSEVKGPSETSWYASKPQALLHKILCAPKFKVYIFGDDRDAQVCKHLTAGPNDTAFWLPDVAFLAARAPDRREYGIATALESLRLPHALECAGGGTGLKASRDLVNYYLNLERATYKAASRPELTLETPQAAEYQVGEVIRSCRRMAPRNTLMPEPQIRTIMKPVQDEHGAEIECGERQWDLGVPTGVFLPEEKQWLLLYKAADGPSKSSGGKKDVVSNVFAALYDAESDRVIYFDRDRRSENPHGIKSLIKSTLAPHYSKNGEHDPRLTWIDGLNKALLTACAFNKDEQEESIREAGGDPRKALRGATTELFSTSKLLDPASYEAHGIIGPEGIYFKNMLFFPGLMRDAEGEYLLLMTRVLPSIQCFKLRVKDLFRFKDDPDFRKDFWQKVLSSESVEAHTVIAPALLHEGFNNPNFPSGQVAPGPVPIAVEPAGECAGEKCWLLIYNSAPDYHPRQSKGGESAAGRVINAALLNYHHPWEVIARAPLPIIVPRDSTSARIKEGVKIRHPNVAFAGGGGVDQHGRLVIFYTEGDTLIRAATWRSAQQLAEYIRLFDAEGRPRHLSPYGWQ